MLQITPSNIPLFKPAQREAFCLLTTKALKNKINIVLSAQYKKYLHLFFEEGDDIHAILNRDELAEADVLFIPYGLMDDKNFRVKAVKKSQRFIRFNCCKTPINLALLEQFIQLLHTTNPTEQHIKAEHMFDLLEVSDRIVFENTQHHKTATLEISPEILWTEAYAVARFGEPVSFPNGEIVISHDDFQDNAVPPITSLNGEMILKGFPILHRVVPQHFFPEAAQAKMFQDLCALHHSAALVTIEAGVIQDIVALDPGAAPAVRVFQTLFDFDARFRTVSELGFGLDSQVNMMPERNTILNEAYGGQGICFHLGLGSLQTALHLDVICPETALYAENAEGRTALHTISAESVSD